MTFQEFRVLVRKGEGQHIEFKRKIAHPEKVIREVIAFANTNGGHILIGVDDNGTIPGVKFADEEVYVLDKAIEQFCKPAISYQKEIVAINEKRSVIDYEIFEADKKPVYLLDPTDNRKRKTYIRVNDQSIQASKEMREILRRKEKTNGIKFNYGEKEKLLMSLLDSQRTITIKKFAYQAGISNYKASRTLVLLVLANVLNIEPCENEDEFTLAAP